MPNTARHFFCSLDLTPEEFSNHNKMWELTIWWPLPTSQPSKTFIIIRLTMALKKTRLVSTYRVMVSVLTRIRSPSTSMFLMLVLTIQANPTVHPRKVHEVNFSQSLPKKFMVISRGSMDILWRRSRMKWRSMRNWKSSWPMVIRDTWLANRRSAPHNSHQSTSQLCIVKTRVIVSMGSQEAVIAIIS